MINWALVETNIRLNTTRLVRSLQGKLCGYNEYSWLNPVDMYVVIIKDMYKGRIKRLDSVRLRKLRKYCNKTLSFPPRPNPGNLSYHDYLGTLERHMVEEMWAGRYKGDKMVAIKIKAEDPLREYDFKKPLEIDKEGFLKDFNEGGIINK